MGETYLLTLEVEDNGTVKVQRFKQNLEAAGGATEKAGKQTEAGRMGFFLLGEAAEEAGRTVGVSGQVMRQVGTTVENVAARSFPKWGAALGVAGLAGTAVVGVVTMLIDRKKRLAEETLKAASAAEDWIDKARTSTKETWELRDANERLWEVEKKRSEFNLKQGIAVEEEKIADLAAKARRIKWWIENDPDGGSLAGMIIAGTRKSRSKNLEDAELELESAHAALQRKKALLAIEEGAGGGVKRKIEGKDGGKTTDEDLYAKRLQDEADYARASLGLSLARGDAEDRILLASLDAFDAAAIAKAQKLKDQDELKVHWALADMDRQTLVLNHEKQVAEEQRRIQDKTAQNFAKNEQLKRQAMAQTAGNFSQTFSIMYSMGGAHARKWFTLHKTAATAEATINAYQGYTKAIAQGGIWGQALAYSILALGLAQVAKIQSMEFNAGGGDMGGGAVATYSADAGTGLPDNGGYKYYGYEQSQYGSGWRPGEGPGGTNITINAVDAKSFEQLCRDNPVAITGVVNQDIKDRGDTLKTIQRHAM